MKALENSRVYIIDDDEISLQIVEDYLGEYGISVVLEPQSVKAIDWLASNDVDAVLLDVEMPIQDGRKTARLIRELGGKFEHLPLVAMTGHDVISDHDGAKDFSDHIVKPIDPDLLIQKLTKLICSNPLETHQVANAAKLEANAAKKSSKAINEDIPSLPGFELDIALSRLRGNWGMLKKVIIRYGKSEAGSSERVRHFINQQNWVEVSRFCHGVKGTAGTIGAVNLADMAGKIETLIKEDKQPDSLLLDNFLTLLNEVRQTSLSLVDDNTTQTNTNDTVSNTSLEGSNTQQSVEPQLEKVLSLCDELSQVVDVDIGIADEKVELLLALTKDTNMEHVGKRVNSLFETFDTTELKRYLKQVN